MINQSWEFEKAICKTSFYRFSHNYASLFWSARWTETEQYLGNGGVQYVYYKDNLL